MIKERRAKLDLKKKLKTQNKMFRFLFDLHAMHGWEGDEYICVCLFAKSERFFMCRRENVYVRHLADPC
jgi:hypothetical protein